MSRPTASTQEKEEDSMPKSGAGSEYGRERREEARKRRRGYGKKVEDPDAAPWNLKIGGKGGKRYSGRKEAGINENSNYYILTQCPDGAFEAVPVTSWYNFTPNINYRTLTTDEAEEEFLRRDKTVNYFSLMVKKRLQNNDDEEELEKEKGGIKVPSNMKILDDEDLKMSNSDDDDDEDDDKPVRDKIFNAQGKEIKKMNRSKKKGEAKQKKGGTDEESDASSEEDGYFDSKEVDYMSDSSSSSEDIKVDISKPDTKDDLNAESSESEEDDELTNAGKDIKKMLQKDRGEGGSSEEEDEDPEGDDVKGTSALFLQEKKKGKKKNGSRSSTSSSSRSSTPTAGLENQPAVSTVAAAAKKLEGRPATPTGKGKKRPASEPAKTGFVSISDSPSSKKARVSPGPSSLSGSACNTPTPADNGNSITEDSVRRYLARKPMTTKDLLQKFNPKKTGLTNEQTIQLIATILKKIQPEQKTIKGKLYLSLKSSYSYV
ncbi:general transcription factor IIF subunit 1-like isoform X2 [Actinia tenebrosa]|nr:general transcription factor IIF subunit 1-like isoform X2 [Actinia tenebrosa]